MRYVVGYAPNHRGLDAVNLASTLAGSRAASLDIVVVMPLNTLSFDRYSPDRAYHAELELQGQEWLDEAMALVPEGITARPLLRRAESITEGLIDAAVDPDLGEEASLIVVGAARRGLLGRFTIGSAASALLHSSPVPVALATAGYKPHPGITRVTCATGTREGTEALVDDAIGTAAIRGIPLRLMSLVALGAGGSKDERAAWTSKAEEHVAGLAARAVDTLPESAVSTIVGSGDTLEDAVYDLDFSPSEVVMVGSSRLAGPKRLFIGSSASKILRALPVPMIVVPRDYDDSSTL